MKILKINFRNPLYSLVLSGGGLRCCTDHPPHLPSIPIHPLAHARCPPLPIPWRRRAANHHSDHHSVPVKHPTVSCGRRAHAGRPSSSSSPSANITMSLRGSRTRFSRGARRPIGDGAVEYSTAAAEGDSKGILPRVFGGRPVPGLHGRLVLPDADSRAGDVQPGKLRRPRRPLDVQPQSAGDTRDSRTPYNPLCHVDRMATAIAY